MKPFKIISFRALLKLSLVLLLFNFSCNKSEGKSAEKTTDSKESLVKAPEIDIQAAIITNNIEAIQQHIEAGTDLNKKDAFSGSTPIVTAASFGKKEIAQLLIDAGADLTSANNDGATALHTAAFFCRTEIVQLLLDAHADTSLRNKFGATPRESVEMPFQDVKPIYEMLKLQLEPMGMEVDIDYIEKTRPVVAEMLK